jgi:hypothetical protein
MSAFLVFLWLAAGVDLQVHTDCPSRAEVSSELDRLAGPGTGDSPPRPSLGPPLSADLTPSDQGLAISLRNQTGELLAQRTLAGSGSCADLAAAAAVIIATWQGEMRADLGPELPSSPGPRRTRSTPEPSSVAATITASPPSPPVPPMSERPWEVGAAVLGAHAGDVSAGAVIDVQVGRAGSSLGGRAALLVEGSHAVALGPEPGRARWSRAALDAGLKERVWLGALAFDVRAQIEAAVIRLQGDGFSTNYDQTGVEVGVGLGGRLAWPQGRFAPFVGFDAWTWPGRQAVIASGTGFEASLPRFELQVSAGVSLGRFR